MRRAAIACFLLTSVAAPAWAGQPLPSGAELPPVTPAGAKPLPSGAQLPPLPDKAAATKGPPADAGGRQAPASEMRAYAPDPGWRHEQLPGDEAARQQAQRNAQKHDQAQAARPETVPRGPHGRTCFNQSETREKIVAHRLIEPFHALRTGGLEGEALRAKLCKSKQDEFVYEIFMLRRDGHVVRVLMNAENGKTADPDHR